VGPFSNRPSAGDLREWLRVEVVELGSSTTFGHDQPSRLEDAEVLGDRLAREAEAMSHREQGTDLEECLAVARRQLVEDQTPGLVVESAEHIGHASE
jgi:hypothetical protein